MSREVISEPFVGREESRGGFGRQRLFVTVRHDDGTTERVLAADAVPKKPRGKVVEGSAVLTPVARPDELEAPEESA